MSERERPRPGVGTGGARGLALLVLLGALGAATIWLLLAGGGGPPRRERAPLAASLSVAEALGADVATGFRRAGAPRQFAFPRDHGPHPEYRTEWWYYTGNLATPEGRHFGFQLTFFRQALAATPPARASRWGTSHVYLAHLALTDTEARRFHATARTSRAALGLAGATAEPFRVWLEDWTAEGGGPDGLPMRLRAAADEVAIDLVLDSAKPVVLQGEGGVSQKGPEPGNASYYYSLTRMPARGSVRVGGRDFAVQGLAWMDREWGTSALGPDLAGWDWFALQLEDGRELMYYRLRRRDGAADPLSAGTLIDAQGAGHPLRGETVRLEVLDHWVSPRSGVRYPARWRISEPASGLALEIVPRLPDQELIVGPRYWEGAVAVTGEARGRAVAGHGYAELVGYGEAGARRRLP